MNGWSGKILRIDLTKAKAIAQPLPRSLALNYIGARGINARILWDELPPGADPLGPENILIFGAGPLSGTFAPSSGRLTITSKSPASNMYVRTSVGGHFAADMKLAGWDNLVFYGASQNPVYLWIDNDEVELRDASFLWGKTVRDTVTELREELGDRDVKVAAIGPGGENMVRFASIMTSIYRAAGRAGAGAVMGSKKLKAIVVRGTGCVTVADPERFQKIALKARKDLRGDESFWPGMYLYGTDGWITPDSGSSLFLGAKNFRTENVPVEMLRNLSGSNITDNFLTGREGCTCCVVNCGRFTAIKDGPYAGSFSGGPELETVCAFGGKCYISQTEPVLKANELCNLYGLDTISTGSTIAFAMECYEKGLISKKEANGLALEWGSPEAVLGLIEKIARREGIGDILAEGTKKAAERIGGEAYKYAVQAKGVENASGDGRRFRAHSALAFAVNPKGPDHLHTEVIAEMGGTPDAKKVLEMLKVPNSAQAVEGKDRLVKWHEEMYCAADSLGLCAFINTCSYLKVEFKVLAEMFDAATGISTTERELQLACERIVNVEKAINVREGATRKDDSLPWRILNEQTFDGAKLTKEDLDVMLDGYYKLHGWNKETSWPTEKTLVELGLTDIAKELKRQGKLP